jgi:hypothetical protein
MDKFEKLGELLDEVTEIVDTFTAEEIPKWVELLNFKLLARAEARVMLNGGTLNELFDTEG